MNGVHDRFQGRCFGLTFVRCPSGVNKLVDSWHKLDCSSRITSRVFLAVNKSRLPQATKTKETEWIITSAGKLCQISYTKSASSFANHGCVT